MELRSNIISGWIPRQELVQKIVQLIEASLATGTSNETHKMLQQEVDSLSLQPEFCRYLAFIFAEAHNFGASDQMRYMSSLILLKALRIALKNNILDQAGAHHVQQSILHTTVDPNESLRKSACSLVSTYIAFGSLTQWPDLVQFLKEQLQNPSNENAYRSSMLIFEHLCEDCGLELDHDPRQPLLVFIPLMLQAFKNPDVAIRIHALHAINFLMELDDLPVVISAHVEDVLQGLAYLSQDPNQKVKKSVCQGLTLLLAWRIDAVGPHLSSIVQLMLEVVQGNDSEVAIEGCDFFTHLCEEPTIALPICTQLAPQLLPALVGKLPYSEEELMTLDDTEDDTAVPDRPEDVCPNAGHDSDDDDEDDTYYAEWTIRKGAGLALESLSQILPGNVALPILMPVLQEHLTGQNWITREAALLALGAISKGYQKDLEPHLPNLVPFLLEQTKDKKSLVRLMACWALVKYADWVCEQAAHTMVREYIVAFSTCMMDRNKRVQHAACSSLATFVEKANDLMNPFLGDLSEHIARSYKFYQANNKMVVLDLVGTLYEHCADGMSNPQIFHKIIPGIWHEFVALPDDNRFLLFYLECFASILRSIGKDFDQVAKPLYDRCIHLIEQTLTMIIAAPMVGEVGEDVEKEFMNGALDVISAFADGFDSDFSKLWDANQFLSLVAEILKIRDTDTLQVVYALLGDLSRVVPNEFRAIVPLAMSSLNKHVYPVDDYSVDVNSNAAWAIGMIANSLGADIRQFASQSVTQLSLALCTDDVEPFLQNNCAISLGRIARTCPDLVGPHLEDVGSYWCTALTSMTAADSDVDPLEKSHCLEGLIAVVRTNPSGIHKHFSQFCICLLGLEEDSAELAHAVNETLKFVIQSLHQSGRWNSVSGSLSKQVMTRLKQRHIVG